MVRGEVAGEGTAGWLGCWVWETAAVRWRGRRRRLKVAAGEATAWLGVGECGRLVAGWNENEQGAGGWGRRLGAAAAGEGEDDGAGAGRRGRIRDGGRKGLCLFVCLFVWLVGCLVGWFRTRRVGRAAGGRRGPRGASVGGRRAADVGERCAALLDQGGWVWETAGVAWWNEDLRRRAAGEAGGWVLETAGG